MEYLPYITTLLLSFLAEIYGGIIGGGSIVTQIALQGISGLEPRMSIAIDNFASMGTGLGTIFLLRKKVAVKPWFFVYILSQVLGAVLGSTLLALVPIQFLTISLAVCVIGLTVYNFFAKHSECQTQDTIPVSIWLLIPIGILIGTYNALFVIGDYVLSLIMLTTVLKVQHLTAIYMLCFSSLAAQTTASIVYTHNGLLDFSYAIPMFIAMFFSGLISATILQKLNTQHFNTLLKIVGLGMGGYLVFLLVQSM